MTTYLTNAEIKQKLIRDTPWRAYQIANGLRSVAWANKYKDSYFRNKQKRKYLIFIAKSEGITIVN